LKHRLNNRGFSLVELLIGVTILAIVVAPLIHAFVTSAATSSKAKRLRSETIAAQNILESYKATSIDMLLNSIASGDDRLGDVATITGLSLLNTATNAYEAVSLGSAGDIVSDGPGYKLELNDIRVDDRQYDAVLYLDATTFDQNDAEIVSYKAMDALYVEPNPRDAAKRGESPDYIAAQTFASEAAIESGNNVNPEDFLGKMARDITITIQKVGSDSDVISCTALFQYTTVYDWYIPQFDKDGNPLQPLHPMVTLHTTWTHELYSGGYDGSGSYGIYFFFWPNTCSATLPAGITKEDAIRIYNGENLPISVVLIRQGDELPSYAPLITLHEKSYDFEKPPYATLHYSDDNVTGRYYYSWETTFHRPIYFDGILVDTEAQNRLYEVKVALYKDGANLDTDEPLAVFDATSLG
jgi:prepilin-type N-terminal cleavage/methylation domain-containing protein